VEIGDKLRAKGCLIAIAELAGFSERATDNPFMRPVRRLQAV